MVDPEQPRAPKPRGALSARAADGVLTARPAGTFARALEQVHSYTLENGLRLLIWPDPHIPNIAFYNWVHVGSRNESTGSTGLAHFFEHMMFNGTRHRAQGEFDRLMEASGASNNAYTSQDVTVYQAWFPRAALPLVLDL